MIGANIEEAQGGVSKDDLLNKLSISYKESRKTQFWLKLLNANEYINQKEFESIFHDADELSKLLYSIINSSK